MHDFTYLISLFFTKVVWKYPHFQLFSQLFLSSVGWRPPAARIGWRIKVAGTEKDSFPKIYPGNPSQWAAFSIASTQETHVMRESCTMLEPPVVDAGPRNAREWWETLFRRNPKKYDIDWQKTNATVQWAAQMFITSWVDSVDLVFFCFPQAKWRTSMRSLLRERAKATHYPSMWLWLLPPVAVVAWSWRWSCIFEARAKRAKERAKKILLSGHIATSLLFSLRVIVIWYSHDILMFVVVEGSRKLHVYVCAYVLLHSSCVLQRM